MINSSMGSLKFLNRFAQFLSTNILGMKVDPKVSNWTILSTTVGALSKLLDKDWKFKKVLNLLLSKSSDEWQVLFDIGDDVRSITCSLLWKERWYICKKNSHTKTMTNTSKETNLIRYKLVYKTEQKF